MWPFDAKENRKKKIIEDEKYNKWLQKEAEDCLGESREKMSKMFCPTVGKNCIMNKCIHFQDGYIYDDSFYLFDNLETFYSFNKPVCKLWQKK